MSSVVRVPRFVEQHTELELLLLRLPLLACTHCGRCGNLIGHGFLRGYTEHTSERVTRGRRVLCSNRGRKRGCGRTVSTLLIVFIERCAVTAATLWALFCGLADGLSVAQAAERALLQQTLRSAYRTANALKRSALGWRSWLVAHEPVPTSNEAQPLGQLRAHLSSVLGRRPFEHEKFRHTTPIL